MLLKQALENAPGDVDLHGDIGLSQRRLGMWQESIASFRKALELDPDYFDTFVVKSRVHFRRGFDETGYAKTIIIVDAPGPFVGTIRLDALPYENVNLSDFYPYGTPPDRQ